MKEDITIEKKVELFARKLAELSVDVDTLMNSKPDPRYLINELISSGLISTPEHTRSLYDYFNQRFLEIQKRYDTMQNACLLDLITIKRNLTEIEKKLDSLDLPKDNHGLQT